MTTQEKQPAIGPSLPSERMTSLDVLRGVAVLGILFVNIQSFSMVFAAYPNPTLLGDLTGLNYASAFFSNVFVQFKFLTIFSVLFGAGILLMARNIEERGRKPAGPHYRRMMWLLILGLLHAYLLWFGDILAAYALSGMAVYLFRKKSPKKLFIFGVIAVTVGGLSFVLLKWSLPHWPPELYQQALQGWLPGKDLIAQEIAIYRGSWFTQMAHRVPSAITYQTFIFITLTFWRAAGVMLMGMALFKWGAFEASVPLQKHRKAIIIGSAVGLPVIILGWFMNFRYDWSFEYSMFLGNEFNYWGSLFLSAAYIGAILFLCSAGKLSAFTRRFAAVGRMAFTNYILQTLICTTIFYGHGFGLYGKVSRWGQFLMVLVIFGFQMWWSPLWLKHFRYGPLEWAWRCLTYWKRFKNRL